MTVTTFSVTASADDGFIARYDDSLPFDWPPTASLEDWAVSVAASNITMTASVYGSASELTNAFIRFDTSSIPDGSTVTAATLKLTNTGTLGDTDNRALNVEWYTPGAWPPSNASDWTNSVGTTGGSFDLTGLTASVTNDLTLSNPTNVNQSGYTSFRLGISYDGGTPVTGFNRFWAESFDSAAQEPQLEVTYTEPEAGPKLIVMQANRATW